MVLSSSLVVTMSRASLLYPGATSVSGDETGTTDKWEHDDIYSLVIKSRGKAGRSKERRKEGGMGKGDLREETNKGKWSKLGLK